MHLMRGGGTLHTDFQLEAIVKDGRLLQDVEVLVFFTALAFSNAFYNVAQLLHILHHPLESLHAG